ncbi:heparinase II/III family protein [Phenylobacterium deserti]|uniref:Heparinase n=1 Tax=Phenylobacterium deserti TaxID=1914756 RepID=A0A328ARV5_9CAUL|nr:heparinase II/III family protein [Phenylobacterium deserti]RAK57367.1 heparinase [Phenylobacterium deserti]
MASPLAKLPARYLVQAVGLSVLRQAAREWTGTPPHLLSLSYPKPDGFSAQPKDLRPPERENGLRIMSGAFVFGGETVAPGPRGDPWNRASPSRRFAVGLHRFGWMRDLLTGGPEAAAEGLRLTLEWRRTFGRWNAFSWSSDVLERRVFNLACAGRAITARASDAETAQIALDLARQARFLLGLNEGPARAAERACAAAVAGCALADPAGERLMTKALAKLVRALPVTVQPDGGHASRSPQAALELLFDLLTLDEALSQRGLPPPEELIRAIDRLGGAVRFFTLADGRLAAFQGGEAASRAYIAAARSLDDTPPDASGPVTRNGYQRLESRALQVLADAAPPAKGAWSVTACAQPLAIEVLVGGKRLVVGGGWSPNAQAPQAMRLVDAASTASVGDAHCGQPLRGFPAQVLGPRLVSAPDKVEARRHEAEGAQWLEMSHDGWAERFGLRHERRLYVDVAADELRGEDRFSPTGAAPGPDGRRFIPFMVRFHLAPGVQAQVARDKKSVLLKPEGGDAGWWLRNDALEVAIEPSVHYERGMPRRSQQIVLRGQARLESGARVRWKLSQANRVDAPAPDA